MADESTDISTKEQMAICLRYVKEGTGTVFEDFIGFVEMDKVDSASITDGIVGKLRECGLDIKNLRGQGYDGASVMSGHVSGVKTRIQQLQPRAVYHQCRAHILNLVVASSCKSLPDIRNLFDAVNQLTWFLGGSAKRKAIVARYLPQDDTHKLIVSETDVKSMGSCALIYDAAKKDQIPRLCDTRWTARVDTLSALIAKYKCIMLSLKDILTESSDSEARLKAGAHIRMMQGSQFIVALVVVHHVLSYTRSLSQALQKSDCDIVKASGDVRVCKTTVNNQRKDEIFKKLWKTSNGLAECVDVEIEKPRVSKRMTHRASSIGTDDTSFQYYKINVFFPFIDHCVARLQERFPDDNSAMYLGSDLMPTKVGKMAEPEMEKIFDWYSPDLPDQCTFYTEVERWQVFCEGLSKPPSLLSDCLTLADRDYYPNIHEIFKLLLTMPVGSVPCERSFSALRRLKQWNRTTMKEDRLNGLALLHIHKDREVSSKNVLDSFDASGNRRIGKLNL